MNYLPFRILDKAAMRPFGLWELYWEILACIDDYQSEVASFHVGRRLLRHFLSDELVKLYLHQWGTDEYQELELYKALQVVEYKQFWVAPDMGQWGIVFKSTEKGEHYSPETVMPDFQ
jgi:hypothetical protein